MKKRKIGVDLDGVLVDSLYNVTKVGLELTGKNISMENMPCYRMQECTEFTPEELNKIFSDPFYFMLAPGYQTNIKVINQLHREGHEIHLITARPKVPHIFHNTTQWLADNGVEADSLHIVPSTDKTELAKSLKLDYFIEDSPYNAKELAEVVRLIFFVQHTYNQEYILPRNVIRVGRAEQPEIALVPLPQYIEFFETHANSD